MGKVTDMGLAGPDDPIFKGGPFQVFTPKEAHMGKVNFRGFAVLGECGQLSGGFITGANLASSLKRKPKPEEKPKQGEPNENNGDKGGES